MLSMTGYGRADYNCVEFDLSIEIKTVNNRNLDLNIKAPRAFISLEDVIRKTISTKIGRGRVDVFISFSDNRENQTTLKLDENVLNTYLEIAKTVSKKCKVKNALTLFELLRFPDVIKNSNVTESYENLSDVLKATVESACDNLISMRKVEGEKLFNDFNEKIAMVESLTTQIKGRAPEVAKEYREKLQIRMKEILSDVNYDEARLLSEVAYFTDKSNIDEEITRLYSHISQFKKLISQDGTGKKLDFLMQEFNREANTICSKANDVCITDTALSLKCEIEKIREQVQNVE